MLPLPRDLANTSQLCDMVEMMALCADDGNSSLGDLDRVLDVANYAEMEQTDNEDETEDDNGGTPKRITTVEADDAVERRRNSVYAELEGRVVAASQGYPFCLSDRGVLQLKSEWHNYPAYTFCLCLSYRVWCSYPDDKPAQRLFGHLAATAAACYIGGRGIRFDSPREGLPRGFTEAIDELSRLIGEGGGWNGTPPAKSKDDDLDLVAWRPFPDGLPGKLLLFGQCTTGYDWSAQGKTKSLDPGGFCGNWLKSVPSPRPVKTFFVPHVISTSTWHERIHHIRSSGLFFDRCRIALCAQERTNELTKHAAWAARELKRFTSRKR